MEQKENGWWKKSFVERHVMPMGDIPKLEGEKITYFISQVEQDARKDERERVMWEAIELVESTELEEAPPFSASNEFREKATLINENLMPLVKAGLIKALKGLSDNKK